MAPQSKWFRECAPSAMRCKILVKAKVLMSFIDSIKGLFQKQANPAIFGFFANSSMPKMGEKEFLKAYRGWVHACVNAIAQPIADIEVKLEQKTKDGWQEVE